MVPTEFIEYPSRADMVAGLPAVREREDVLAIDVVDLGRTLRVVTDGSVASEEPVEPPVAPNTEDQPAGSSDSAEGSEEEDLIGAPEAEVDWDFVKELVRASSLAELEASVEGGVLTPEQIYTVETAEDGRHRQNVTHAFAPDED